MIIVFALLGKNLIFIFLVALDIFVEGQIIKILSWGSIGFVKEAKLKVGLD